MTSWKKQNILPHILMVYMLLALLWWSYLLFQKNSDVTTEKLKNLQLEYNIMYKVNNYDIKTLDEFKSIISKHNRQKYMIIGEGIVFAFTLIIGMTLINRAFRREVATSTQQNNFLLSITHELRSPLASISLILETLKKRVLTSEKVKELSGDALIESKRLDKQITNLLLAAKLDKTYTYNFQNENIKPIATRIINRYQHNSDVEALTLSFSQDDITHQIDKEGFSSLITNLIENAIKYSKQSAEIDITISKSEDDLILKVGDKGVGIPDIEKKKVLKQFYRVGNEDTRTSKGTGLGLYIVDQIIKAHKGTLSISDNFPNGTIITVKIPGL